MVLEPATKMPLYKDLPQRHAPTSLASLTISYLVQSFTLTICHKGSEPWGHGRHALVFSVTCMEQLNAQKLLATLVKAKARKPSIIFAAIP